MEARSAEEKLISLSIGYIFFMKKVKRFILI